MERLNHQVVTAMDGYDLQQAVRPFVQFIEDLTNWYIRRSRRRFWKSSNDEDKAQAYATLYAVLLRLSKIAAPFVPFTSDAIYRNLRTADMPESVHLCDFPLHDDGARDLELEAQMDEVIDVVGRGRQLRSDHNLKVRQPLRRLHVVSRDQAKLDRVATLKELVEDELNVREVVFHSRETDLVVLSAKADFRRLGPRLGPAVKEASAKIQGLSQDELSVLYEGGELRIEAGGVSHAIGKDDLVIQRTPKSGLAVAASGDVAVALDTELDDELIREGLAREFVNKVQTLRKTADFDIAQRIRLVYRGPEAIRAAVSQHADYIQAETLAVSCAYEAGLEGAGEEVDLNGHACRISLTPI
jgi:isoleucyl-tRNA synthetase